MTIKRQLLLNDKSEASNAKSVVYVMSRDQRVKDNHALLYAQQTAIESNLSLVVLFNLLPESGVRAREHFSFMIDGLKDLEANLKKLNIGFQLTIGDSAKNIVKFVDQAAAKELIFDFNPLHGSRKMQKQIAKQVGIKTSVVDTHNIIPVWVTSDKEEYAAHTIRSKIHKNLEQWLVEPDQVKKHPTGYSGKLSVDFNKAANTISKIKSNGIKIEFRPGEKAANKLLHNFIENNLDSYAASRNVPTIDGQSELSPYLHFGHISALRIGLELIRQSKQRPLLFEVGKLASYEGEPTKQDSINALLEELIVRKELADNYCFYNPNYRSLEGAKDWARQSLKEHQGDKRDYVYSLDQLEQAKTHDQAWNAAQKQMTRTGKMHGYMRMYWAKKILEWTDDPQQAIQHAIYLNDHYSIDGGDPNGYTGIMWSIAGVHDRPWFERAIFGKIRYMNMGGLKRKFKLEDYIQQWK